MLADDRVVLGKILDPTFATDVEFLIAIGRVFGLALPPRSSAALKNALKNFFFETAILEKRTLVLTIDEAQNLSDENLEALRLLLNYQVPQRKLLNILLFGQPRTRNAHRGKGNLADRVDGWIRFTRWTTRWPRRFSTSGSASRLAARPATLHPRRARAADRCGRRTSTPDDDGRALGDGRGRDRASTQVNEDHVRAAMISRGIVIARDPNRRSPALRRQSTARRRPPSSGSSNGCLHAAPRDRECASPTSPSAPICGFSNSSAMRSDCPLATTLGKAAPRPTLAARLTNRSMPPAKGRC